MVSRCFGAIVLGLFSMAVALGATGNNLTQSNIPAKKAPAHLNQPHLINRIVAFVNNQALTLNDFQKALAFAKLEAEQSGIPITDEKAFSRQVMSVLINETIALQLAKMNHLTVGQAKLDAVFQHVAAVNHLSLKALKKKIEASGITFADYQQQIKNKLIIRKLEQEAVSGSIVVTQAEIHNYLAQQEKSGAKNTLYHVAHILIAPKGQATPVEIAVAKNLAEHVAEKIHHGMAFSSAAAQYSQASDALKGGKLPWNTLNALPTIFVGPIQTMHVGAIYGPFLAQGAFHIIKLLAKKTPAAQTHFETQYQLKQIMIKTSPIKTAMAAQQTLAHLRSEIVANPKKFAALAEQYSDDHDSSSDGGQLGWVALSSLPPAVASKVAALKAGELSEVINGQNGQWYLVQLEKTRKKNNTQTYLEGQARLAIFNKKALAALSIWEAQIRGASYVKILDKRFQ